MTALLPWAQKMLLDVKALLDDAHCANLPSMEIRDPAMRYSEIEMENPKWPDPMPRLTIHYYPNGKPK